MQNLASFYVANFITHFLKPGTSFPWLNYWNGRTCLILLNLGKMEDHAFVWKTWKLLHAHIDDMRLVFVSHRWLRPHLLHPDDERGTKLQMIVNAGTAYCEKQSINPGNCFLWIDYTCINQPDLGCKERSIRTLPFYIMMCVYRIGSRGL